MAVIISWIKTYSSANDGEILTGQELGDFQTAINNHDHTFVTGTFLTLSDVPASYSGQSLKGVRVNAAETGLEFYTTGGGGGGSSNSYSTTFTNADLSGGGITITHSLGIRAIVCQVFDNAWRMINPDYINPNGTDTVFIDLTSYGTITGTWTVKVVA